MSFNPYTRRGRLAIYLALGLCSVTAWGVLIGGVIACCRLWGRP
jgi:hypothetical protein